MLTISIAQFFINIAGKKAVQAEVPAGLVLNSPQRASLRVRAFLLLPSPLQNRIRQRQSARLEALALARLAETSPHLLADIGVVPQDLATFDGRSPQERNTALTSLARQPVRLPATGLAGAVV